MEACAACETRAFASAGDFGFWDRSAVSPYKAKRSQLHDLREI